MISKNLHDSTKKSAWTPTESDPTWSRPEYARFKLCYNAAFNKDGSPNMNTINYKEYFSLDWNNKTNQYDEMQGLRGLIERMILNKPYSATRWAKLYINLTLDLSTANRNYEHLIGYWNGHENKLPKFKPEFVRIGNALKIDITTTLLRVRDLKEQMNMNKFYSR